MVRLISGQSGRAVTLTDKQAGDLFPGNKEKSFIFLPSNGKVSIDPKYKITAKKVPKRVNKVGGICVIRLGGLGDLAILSSTLVKIKKASPLSELTVATSAEYVPLVKKFMGVDRCISADDVDSYAFDKVIDLRYAVEPSNVGPGTLSWMDYVSKDRSDNFDKLCGVNSKRKYFNLPVSEEASEKVEGMLGMLPGQRSLLTYYIGLNVTCKSPIRVIPPDYVRQIVDRLTDIGAVVVILGKTEDWNQYLHCIRPSRRIINLLDKLTEPELIAACSLVNLIIASDTGVLHIAGALGKKCLGIFGNIDPRTRTAYYPNTRTIFPKGELDCIPCWDVPGCCDIGKPGAPCMRLITPERIHNAVARMI